MVLAFNAALSTSAGETRGQIYVAIVGTKFTLERTYHGTVAVALGELMIAAPCTLALALEKDMPSGIIRSRQPFLNLTVVLAGLDLQTLFSVGEYDINGEEGRVSGVRMGHGPVDVTPLPKTFEDDNIRLLVCNIM